jgi:hypothetical protein
MKLFPFLIVSALGTLNIIVLLTFATGFYLLQNSTAVQDNLLSELTNLLVQAKVTIVDPRFSELAAALIAYSLYLRTFNPLGPDTGDPVNPCR